MMPAIYGNSYEIIQSPGWVAIRYEMIHETRLIPLDARPHVRGGIQTYMGDARRSALPLVGSDESDWTILFSHWGVLPYDRAIAAWTRGIGWIGMLLTVAWLGYMHFTTSDD